MKLKDLKAWINQLPENELESDLRYNSVEYGISGTIAEIHKNEEDLYYVDDEPAILFTADELIKRGFTEKQIARLEIEIPK
ncbi:MAG: hypothetical protein EOO93_28805, partial [Pedobacter sp.]